MPPQATNRHFRASGLLFHIFLAWLILSRQCHGQFIQSWQWETINGEEVPTWRPTTLDTPVRVFQFTPAAIFLEYNCYYFKAICQNARTYLISATGSSRKWRSAFSYDFNKRRGDQRRRRQCPGNWKDGHPCPEVAGPGNLAQPEVMGMTGAWDYTDLETYGFLTEREIRAKRDPITGNLIQRSGRYYTCDEFPPAKWVEGGVGTAGQQVQPEGDGGPGYTRCAPSQLNCLDRSTGARFSGVRSEQDWQARIHNALRSNLLRTMGRGALRNEAALFFFRMTNDARIGQAARVWYRDALGDEQVLVGFLDKRGQEGRLSTKDFMDWADAVTLDELHDMGYIRDELVVINDTHNIMQTTNPRGPYPLNMAPDKEVRAATKVMDNVELVLLTSRGDDGTATAKLGNLMASDVSPSLSTYKGWTQQQPQGHPDILSIGESYIRAQIAANSTSLRGNNTSLPIQVRSRGELQRRPLRSSPNVTPYITLVRRDGPAQCGPSKPCLDASCCNRDAMCGIDSSDRKTPCALNLCCSYYGWCGTEDVYCHDPKPEYGKTPCQQGYGSCEVKPSPSCSSGSNTVSGRRVGYYQSWNTRERACDKVYPSQINTRGLTHLFYAFAFFHPTTYEMMPMHPGDIPLYGEFTALKRNGLQTWIAVGGWSFNDPGPTQTAWSDMVSSAKNRAAFISSLIKFMSTYGFEGADLDWEYPVEKTRGGHAGDANNLVLLVKEMRAAFGNRYGISLTLAPDYWYLRGFKPAAMQKYVDFMGFMSYDLHGPWDANVNALGARVRPQTDITDIDKGLTPLWFDGVDPAKINMGIAYYGRTYKLSDTSCGEVGCPFVPGKAGNARSCTNFSGVLSNKEIREIIRTQGVVPKLNATAMVKSFTYDKDSWVGYDDEETIAMKQAFANNRCLGGIMIWSIDFDAGVGGGNGANTHISPQNVTIIPLPHTTVPPRATLTLDAGVATDIINLPREGNQNNAPGPGADKCPRCSFFRLITSTCCGTGGSIGNPIVIPPQVSIPTDISLPTGFVPPLPFTAGDGSNVPAGQPLSKDTVLPKGTIFPKPFVIPADQPLHEGEGDDVGSDSIVWINPDIWNEPNPEIGCIPPCTFVLPPWKGLTTTIDYPRLTYSDANFTTTVTLPPITVTEWLMETIVWNPTSTSGSSTLSLSSSSSSSSTTIVPLIIIPTLARTTTWPVTTWRDWTTRHTTAPTFPTHPPPPPRPPPGPPPPPGKRWPPAITVKPAPPFPVVPRCIFPAILCPPVPPGPPPGGPGSGGGSGTNPGNTPTLTVRPTLSSPLPTGPPPPPVDPGDEEGDEDEDEGEDEETCMVGLPGGGGGGGNGGSGGGGGEGGQVGHTTTASKPTTTSEPPKPTYSTPDPSANTHRCYETGQWARRKHCVTAIEYFCNSIAEEAVSLGSGYLKRLRWWESNYDMAQILRIYVDMEFEVKDGCEIKKFDVNECKRYMLIPVDSCDCSSTEYKKGGYGENNCLRWRFDPTGFW